MSDDLDFSKTSINFGTDNKFLNVEQTATDLMSVTNLTDHSLSVSLQAPEPVHKFDFNINVTSVNIPKVKFKASYFSLLTGIRIYLYVHYYTKVHCKYFF